MESEEATTRITHHQASVPVTGRNLAAFSRKETTLGAELRNTTNPPDAFIKLSNRK
jgi:hypothetical protein